MLLLGAVVLVFLVFVILIYVLPEDGSLGPKHVVNKFPFA